MKVKYTKLQIALEIIGLLLIIGMIIFVCVKWNRLPDQIPGHYNAMGEINRWGSKNEIIIMPVISVLLYVFLTAITFFPTSWNVPASTNEENKEAVYRCARTLLIFTKLEMLGMFVYITYYMVNTQPLPSDFLPVTLVALFSTLTFFVVRIYRLAKK